jgi:hypothetical protein
VDRSLFSCPLFGVQIMAEREGFEPSGRGKPTNTLAVCPIRPLWHLSVAVFYHNDFGGHSIFGFALRFFEACAHLEFNCGGRGGIRTLETLAGLAVFKTAAFNHSATLPQTFYTECDVSACGHHRITEAARSAPIIFETRSHPVLI